MAIVSAGWRMTITRIDATLNRSVSTYELTSADYAAALLDAVQVKDYIEAVSSLALIDYKVYEVFYNDALVIPTDPEVQREVVAVMTGTDSVDPMKVHTLNIIGADPDVFGAMGTPAAKSVDFTNVAVQNFFNMGSVAGEVYVSDGEQFADDGWLSGKRTTRKNSSG